MGLRLGCRPGRPKDCEPRIRGVRIQLRPLLGATTTVGKKFKSLGEGRTVMVQIDVPVAFGIGSLFADAAYRQLQTGQHCRFIARWSSIISTRFSSSVGSPSILCSTISAGRRPTCGGTRTRSQPIHFSPPSSSWSFSQPPTGVFIREPVGQARPPGHQPGRLHRDSHLLRRLDPGADEQHLSSRNIC